MGRGLPARPLGGQPADRARADRRSHRGRAAAAVRGGNPRPAASIPVLVACAIARRAPVEEAVAVPRRPAREWRASGEQSLSEPEGRDAAWTEEPSVSEPEGRDAAWTEEPSGEQSTSDEGRRRSEGGMGRRAGPRRRA